MDNDSAGDRASSLLKSKAQEHSLKFYDYRFRYRGKDLNDFFNGYVLIRGIVRSRYVEWHTYVNQRLLANSSILLELDFK